MKTKFRQSGYYLRKNSKEVVMDYMKSKEECTHDATGIKLAEIFRACGFDWGNYQNASSTNQQYWVIALMRELEKEDKVQRDAGTNLWKLV